MAAATQGPYRAIAMIGVMAMSFALFGCSQSAEPKADLARGPATTVEDAPLPDLPVSGSQAMPSGLTEPLALPRQETPSGYIASAIEKLSYDADEASSQSALAADPAATSDASNPLRKNTNNREVAVREGSDASPSNVAASNDVPAITTPSSGSGLVDAAIGGTRTRVGQQDSEPFDPVKANGPIFTGWPKPKLALIITGMEHGYIEPCGCAGLDRMKGGMSRRHTLFKQLRDQGWPVVGMDVGGIANGSGLQAVLKFHRMVEGKRQMGYEAIALGIDDLQLPAEELLAATADAPGQPSPFVSANVGLFELGAGMPAATRIIEKGGVKIGVTAILGETYRKSLRNGEIKTSDPVEALKKIAPELAKKTSYRILLAHATAQESIALAKAFPIFNMVVTSDCPPEPPKSPQMIEGTKTLLIEVGHKGMDAIVVGFFDDAKKPWRYQRVPLDSRFPASPDMKMIMAAYQDCIKEMGFAGLGLRSLQHPQAQDNGRFVGSKKCESCHEISYNIWKKSSHAHAYDTLAELDPPRNFDPECLSCHVVGWHPTKFFPYEGGFTSKEKTPHLTDAGCENCHGPGEKHVAAELGSNESDRQTFRKRMVVTKAESEKQQCTSCHDGDNSPDFDFKKYWPFVEHKEQE